MKVIKKSRAIHCGVIIGIWACVSSGMALAEPANSTPESFVTAEFLGAHTLLEIGAQYAYAKGYTGKGVLIAIVDDGLDIHHPKFAGKVSPFRGNYMTTGAPDDVGRLPGQVDFDHGTHVAGIAAAARNGQHMHGVAYNADILALRILGDGGVAEPLDDAESQAFDRAIEQGVGVLNGSYGPNAMPALFIEDPLTGESIRNPHYVKLNYLVMDEEGVQESYAAMRRAADADIVMVFAAGNEYEEQPLASLSPVGNAMLPAITAQNTALGWYRFFVDRDRPELDLNNPNTWVLNDVNDPDLQNMDFSDLAGSLIAVVAVDRNGEISSYSNRCGYAQQWCIAAPGGDGDTAGYAPQDSEIYSTMPDGTYGNMAGTSMAAPVVSGAAAVLREAFPYMNAKQVIELILTSANSTDKNWSDKDTYGWGMLDLGRAIDGPVQFGAQGFPLEFDVDTKGWNSVWNNDISGQGGLIKSGQGHIVMNGQNTYQGDTQIKEGKLSVNGSLLNSDLTIERAGALGGTGTVGSLVAAGTIQPGNSIGTLTVAGDYAQLTGSILEIEIDGSGTADLLNVLGQADIQGGELRILGLTADALGKNFTFLDAGQITGTSHFDNADSLGLPYVSMEIQTTAKPTTSSMELSVRRSQLAFAALAKNSNQAAVAQTLDQHNLVSEESRAAVMLANSQAAEQLYSQLSGEIHASSLSAIIDTSGLLRDASLGRLAHADLGFHNQNHTGAEPYGAWARVLGSWGALESSNNAERLIRTIGGMMFGGDIALGEQSRAGLAAALTRSSYRTESMGSATADGYHVMAYAGTSYGDWSIRGGASYSWYEQRTQRRIQFSNMGTQKADYDLQSAQVFAELAYNQQWNALRLEPYLNLAQVWTRRSSFSEDGAVGALQGSSQRYSTAFSTLGLRARYELSSSEQREWSLGAGLGWRHLMGKTEPYSDLRFSTGQDFSIQGAPMARNALMAELGVELVNNNNSRLGLLYVGQLAGRTKDHGVQLRASWAF